MSLLTEEIGIKKMVYTLDECQLLRLWSVMHCFTQIREINDPVNQSEILKPTLPPENQSRPDRDV
jgi:hypothetical protein